MDNERKTSSISEILKNKAILEKCKWKRKMKHNHSVEGVGI